MVQINQPNPPDLRTTEQRIAWGKAHGLPDEFLILSRAEMMQIQQTVEAAIRDNLGWRMVARATFGAKDQKELGEAITRFKKSYAALSLERDRYRLALVKLRDEGNEYAKEILSQET